MSCNRRLNALNNYSVALEEATTLAHTALATAEATAAPLETPAVIETTVVLRTPATPAAALPRSTITLATVRPQAT